jgi:hypothetical protein
VQEIRLTTLGRLIEQCWNSAKTDTANSISQKYHGPNEEQLTFLFASELRNAIAEASTTHKIERAFLSDLKNQIPNVDRVASNCGGLIARVNFHGRQHEGRRSASDLGLVIRRPLVRIDPSGKRIEIHEDHA